MLETEVKLILEIVPKLIRVSAKIRMPDRARILVQIVRFPAERGLVIDNDDFKLVVQNCLNKDLPRLVAYRFVLFFVFIISVTRSGDLLDFGQLFKAFGKNNFAQIFRTLWQFL